MVSYLDLVRRVRGGEAVDDVRGEDVAELARVTGLEPCVVRGRLERMARTVTC
jgi:hypothetical protein